MTEYVVEGWTGGIEQILKANGVAHSLVSGSPTVTLILKDKNGKPIDTTNDVTITDAAAGKVKYSPDAADFVASRSPYTARWKVVQSGETVFFPSRDPDVWNVGTP